MFLHSDRVRSTYNSAIFAITDTTYCGSDGKESACNAGNPRSITRSGRSPGEGNVYLLLYSSLKNSMERAAWESTVHGVLKMLDKTYGLNNNNNIPATIYF